MVVLTSVASKLRTCSGEFGVRPVMWLTMLWKALAVVVSGTAEGSVVVLDDAASRESSADVRPERGFDLSVSYLGKCTFEKFFEMRLARVLPLTVIDNRFGSLVCGTSFSVGVGLLLGNRLRKLCLALSLSAVVLFTSTKSVWVLRDTRTCSQVGVAFTEVLSFEGLWLAREVVWAMGRDEDEDEPDADPIEGTSWLLTRALRDRLKLLRLFNELKVGAIQLGVVLPCADRGRAV
jgi:hypothetical protein